MEYLIQINMHSFIKTAHVGLYYCLVHGWLGWEAFKNMAIHTIALKDQAPFPSVVPAWGLVV